MSYKCAHCGGRHNKPEMAQACAKRARDRLAIPEEALLLPSGHYLIEMYEDRGDGKDSLFLAHIEIRQLVGKWHGHYTVNVYDEHGAVTAVPDPYHRKILTGRVKGQGFRECLKRYGREMAECSICLEPLTAEEAVQGIHKRDRKCYTEIFG